MVLASINRRVGRSGAVSYRVMFRHEGKLRSASFPDLKAAQRFEREVERHGPDHALDVLGRRRGEHLTTGVPLLAEMTEHHIDHLTGVTPGTREEYRRMARRTFLPRLGELPVDVITRDDVAKWVNWLAEQPTRRGTPTMPKTIKNAHALLVSVLDSAVHAGHREANPAHKMRLPRVEKKDHYYLTLEEFGRLLGAVTPRFRTFVWLTGATGMRWGEVSALTWRYVELDDGDPRLFVRLAWKKGPNGDRVLGVPKSARSRRTIGLPTMLAEELRRSRPADAAPGDLVFPGRGGQAIHHSHWGASHYKPALERAGIPRSMTFHDLRHSFASWLLNSGHDMYAVSAAMGHESVNTTTNLYGHIAPDRFRATAAAMGALLATQTFRGNEEGKALENVVDGEMLPLIEDDEE